MKKKLTTIAIRPETRDRLRRFGRKGESYDEILDRLIENRVLELILPRCSPKLEDIGTLEEEGYVTLDELIEELKSTRREGSNKLLRFFVEQPVMGQKTNAVADHDLVGR